MFDFANVWNEIVFGIIFFASGGVFLLFFRLREYFARTKKCHVQAKGKIFKAPQKIDAAQMRTQAKTAGRGRANPAGSENFCAAEGW